MNLGFSADERELQAMGLENEFHFSPGMSHVLTTSAAGGEAEPAVVVAPEDQSVKLEQFVSNEDFNSSSSAASVTNHLRLNLTEWQKSELQGLTPAGIRCLLHSWISLAKNPMSGPHCNATWDEIYCWPATLAGDTVRRPCSEVMKDDADIDAQVIPNLVGDAYRICSEDATWYWGNWTNYNVCLSSIADIHQGQLDTIELVSYLLFIGSILSLLCLCAALFIFYYFKSIRCDRITVHVHLMVALALRFLLLIIIAEPTIFPRKHHYRTVDWICKVILALQFYAMVASVNWMFVQGHYLHSKLTTNVFDQGLPLRIYCSLGWGLPLVLICVWSTVMETLHDSVCWKGYGKSPYVWIIVGPMLFVLLANLLFLGNIMRILLTKIQLTSAASESEQFRRAVKATAVLFPLLGINNLLFFSNPGGSFENYYMIVNTILQSTQGIFVSLLYCFICKDVKDAIRREYGRFSARRNANSMRSQSRRGTGTSYRDKLMKRSQRTNQTNASYTRSNAKLTTGSIRSEQTPLPDISDSPTKLETIKFLQQTDPSAPDTVVHYENKPEDCPGQVVPLVETVQPSLNSNGLLPNNTNPTAHISTPCSQDSDKSCRHSFVSPIPPSPNTAAVQPTKNDTVPSPNSTAKAEKNDTFIPPTITFTKPFKKAHETEIN